MAKMYLDNQPVRIIERSKNQLIPFPYDCQEVQTGDGLTVTVNKDGTILVSGTNTAGGWRNFSITEVKNLPIGTYTFSCEMPNENPKLNFMLQPYIDGKHTGNQFVGFQSAGSPWSSTILNITSATNFIRIIVSCAKEISLSKPILLKPMLNNGAEKPFEPFNQYFRIRTGANIRNPANLIPFPYDIGTQEQNGVSFVVGDKGEITLNGTATANYFFYVKRFNLSKGIYTLSGNTYSSGDFYFYLYNIDTGKDYHAYAGWGKNIELSEDATVLLMVKALSGSVLENATIYPMLVKGTTTKPYFIID